MRALHNVSAHDRCQRQRMRMHDVMHCLYACRDIYWASVQSAKSVFGPDSIRLQPGQLINHFPNHYELTRKVSAAGLITNLDRGCHRNCKLAMSCFSSIWLHDDPC